METLAQPVPRSKYPWWVKLSLLGVPGRPGLWAMVLLSVIAAVVCSAYGFYDSRFFVVGPLFLLAAAPYWASIRWIDRHGSWQ